MSDPAAPTGDDGPRTHAPPPGSPLDAFGPGSWRHPEAVCFGRLAMQTTRPRAQWLALDGDWAFVLRDRPEQVAADDLVGSTDRWGRIEVPGCWTMQGFDIPQYTNVQMPFAGPPPSVPDHNPTGVHRRRVEVPDGWAGQRIVLHVGGAETVVYAFVDGRPVGMGKDSRLAHEFDLTAVVEPGSSFELALVVVRWSDATYLEDQDHWHHAGLHREVALYATPPVHLAQIQTMADWDPETGIGRLRAQVGVDSPGIGPDGWIVRVQIAGVEVSGPVGWERVDDELHNWLMFGGRSVPIEADIADVAPWSAEVPTLHHLHVELVDAKGDVVDTATIAVGFRRVEVRGHELLVNGQPVLIKGVNRHDHDPRRGKAVTRAGMEADVIAMKRHNINAIRTSHYPNDPYLYELCDRLGLYVVDEANLETHAYLRSLTKDPRWAPAIGERIARMAQRDANHPSIILWSLGNESGISPALRAAAEWLRAWDPSRPIHYEGSITEELFGDLVAGIISDVDEVLARPKPECDVIAPMYPSVADLVAWATRAPGPDRPLIMCEYIHAMNNSCGSLHEYWDAIRTYPGLQGGFVWDWKDQALVQARPDGGERLAYGGDFGDQPNDGAFCLNGLVAADLTPHPSLLELAKIVQPVQVQVIDAARGRIRIANERAFTDLSDLTASWQLLVDGEETAAGELAFMSVPPGGSAEMRIPFASPLIAEGQVAHVLVLFALRVAESWAEAGHVVAWEQFEVGRGHGLAAAPGSDPGVPITLERLDPRLALWRAPIDNETFGPNVGEKHADRWARIGVQSAESTVTLASTVVDVDAGHGCVIQHEVVVPDHLDDIARVGVRLDLGPGIATVEWLGEGPHEGYGDRRCSTRVARWTTPVDEWSVPYVHPQSSGNRTGVRWLRLLHDDGSVALVVDQLDELQVTVSRWVDEELAAATHLEDLPSRADRDSCYLWIDAAHRGVGSAAVGPDVAPVHRVGPGTYRWSYRVS